MTDLATIRSTADRLASEARWDSVRDLLGSVSVTELLRLDLAYRFGEALYFTGRITELREHAVAYEQAARALAEPLAVLYARNLAGIAAFELGLMDEAASILEGLIDRAMEEDAQHLMAKAAISLGALANLRGEPEKALTFYQLALPPLDRRCDSRGLGQVHHNLAMSYRDLGKLDDAIDEYRHATRIAQNSGFPPQVAMSVLGRAEIEVLRGDLALGFQLAERGRLLAADIGDSISEGTAYRIRALARVGTESSGASSPTGEEELDAAAADLAQAAELADRTGHALLQAEVWRDLGRLDRRRGCFSQARLNLTRARDALATLGASGAAAELDDELEDLIRT
ncbi:MAG: tetratricopeptide repeat protein [Gemmatimonadales bacterium]|nr:MAG: tetratricopeptide repeat protein [Gemmatimonadales bacterium]